MKRVQLLLTISAVLVLSVLVFTFFGCACWRKQAQAPAVEGFTTDASTDKDDDAATPLTPQEKELFEDLKNNRLGDEEIKTLVANNILNEKLVEKFLNKLSDESDDEDDVKKPVVEGFASVGNTFSCASFGADQ